MSLSTRSVGSHCFWGTRSHSTAQTRNAGACANFLGLWKELPQAKHEHGLCRTKSPGTSPGPAIPHRGRKSLLEAMTPKSSSRFHWRDMPCEGLDGTIHCPHLSVHQSWLRNCSAECAEWLPRAPRPTAQCPVQGSSGQGRPLTWRKGPGGEGGGSMFLGKKRKD